MAQRNLHRNPDMEKATGSVIKDLRLFKNLSQQECAEKTQLTQSQWSSYENGNSRPDFNFLVRMCNSFEIELMVFFCMLNDRVNMKDSTLWLSVSEFREIVEKNQEEIRKIRSKKAQSQIAILEGYLK